MRYVLAMVTLVLAAVLLVLGVGQRTFLAGPAELAFPASTDQAPYLVVDASELDAVPGQGNIVLTETEAFAAVAKTRDVEGWVAPYHRTVLAFDEVDQSFVVAEELVPESTAPEEDADADAAEDTAASEDAEEPFPALDPRGSDLWIESVSGPAEGANAERLAIALQPDESVIIASDGTEPIRSGVQFAWVQDRQTPWAGPLLTAGGVLAGVGIVLYLIAFDHDRRGLGPRRGRKGPFIGIRNMFRKKRSRTSNASGADGTVSMQTSRRGRSRWFALPVLGTAAALALSGCSASYWPSGAAEPEPIETETTEIDEGSSRAPVPVTEGQLARILADIAEVSQTADSELDIDLLEERFTGDALAQRGANYTIRKEVPDYASVPALITDDAREYSLVQSTEGWPRTLFLTTASEAPESEDDEEAPEAPSIALVLTQETPHDNYLVSRVFGLRGGVTMPQAAPAEEGTALVANDIQTLLAPPGEVGALYASILQEGTGAEGADLFDLEGDTLLEHYGAAAVQNAEADSEEKENTLKHSVSVRQGDEPVIALSTGLGGALVATTVIEDLVAESTDDRYKPEATGAVSALMGGAEGGHEKIVRTLSHQLLFYVPNADSNEKIQLLGSTNELIAASGEASETA